MTRAVSGSLSRQADRLAFVDTEAGVCAIGVWQNVVVIVWWSGATARAVERLERVTLMMREIYPQGSTHVHVVKDRAGLPSAEARAGFVKIMKEQAETIANCAVIIGGTGFWASTMRSAITGMRFLSPRSFEMRLHGTVQEIMGWLPQAHAQRTGVELNPALLSRVLSDAERWMNGGYDRAQGEL